MLKRFIFAAMPSGRQPRTSRRKTAAPTPPIRSATGKKDREKEGVLVVLLLLAGGLARLCLRLRGSESASSLQGIACASRAVLGVSSIR